MRIERFSTLLVLAVSPATLVSAIPSSSGTRSLHPHPEDPATSSFQQQHYQVQGQTPLRIWPKVRDAVIESIWGINSKHLRKPYLADKKPPSPGSVSPSSSAPSSLRARYGDDVVLRFSIKTASDVQALSKAASVLFLDIWASTDEWVDIRLAKDVVSSLLGLLPPSLQDAHSPLIHDLAQAVYESYPSPSTHPHDTRRPFGPSVQPVTDATNIFFRDYQPYSVIVPWMRLLASMFSTHVRLISVGTSYEGREILGLRVGVHPTNSEQPRERRKTILITGGAHPREWISVSTANYVAYSLITGYGKSRPMTRLLEGFDWIFIPTVNPDGYIYTWEEDRLWRKNRQETGLPFCRGIDLDRSWGFQWSGEETKNNPCSEAYAGDEPFEGEEAKTLAEWARNETGSNNVEFVGYLDLHSYSQQILYPYAFSCSSVPPTLENLEELAIGIAQAIRRTDREFYEVSSACEGAVASKKKLKQKNEKPEISPRMESTGGSALDWFYHELHVRYAYQIKLRDRGSYGFLLPKENIVPTGKEALNAALVFGKFLIGPEAAGIDWDAELLLLDDTKLDNPPVDGGDPDHEEEDDDADEDPYPRRR